MRQHSRCTPEPILGGRYVASAATPDVPVENANIEALHEYSTPPHSTQEHGRQGAGSLARNAGDLLALLANMLLQLLTVLQNRPRADHSYWTHLCEGKPLQNQFRTKPI